MNQIVVGQWLDAWVVEELLGEGAFAQVYRGRHSGHQHTAALKVPTDPRYVDRLRVDPRALQLEHVHVVRAQELHLDHDPPFLVLDLVEGGNLREAMLLEHVSWDRASKIVEQLASALDHAHDRGVLHLDLKPENVLLDGQGDVHLTDFGVVPPGSQEVLAQSLLFSAELGVVGTRDYAAPEMRLARGTLDRRADVYGLGVVAFELLTGRLPIGLDRPSQLRPDLPPAVDEVLASALARDPARRPSSAGAFAVSLRQALQVEREEPAPRQTQPLALLGGAVGLLLLLVLGAFALSTSPQPPSGQALRELWGAVPPRAPVTLLPVDALESGGKPAARAVRALFDRALLHDDHPVYHPDVLSGFEAEGLLDPAGRAAVMAEAGSRWAVQAAALGNSGSADDAFCALVDLEGMSVVAARPARDEVAQRLAERVAIELAQHPPGTVWLESTVDAAHGVSNVFTARFDAELLCALVNVLTDRHPVLADFGRFSGGVVPVPGKLFARYCIRPELDAERGAARATTLQEGSATALDAQEVSWETPVGYDPTAGAGRLTRREDQLVKLETWIAEAEAQVLARARGALEAGEPQVAVAALSQFRERGQGYRQRIEPVVALAEARLATEDLDGCLETYRQALLLDPRRLDLRARYARVCLEQARTLYTEGKGSWYENDDEDKFARALELLELTERLELDVELRAEIDALLTDVRREL